MNNEYDINTTYCTNLNLNIMSLCLSLLQKLIKTEKNQTKNKKQKRIGACCKCKHAKYWQIYQPWQYNSQILLFATTMWQWKHWRVMLWYCHNVLFLFFHISLCSLIAQIPSHFHCMEKSGQHFLFCAPQKKETFGTT